MPHFQRAYQLLTQILQLGRHPGKLLAGIMKVSRRVFVRDPGQKLAGMTRSPHVTFLLTFGLRAVVATMVWIPALPADARVFARTATKAGQEVLSLSLEQYTNRALKDSLRSRSNEDALASSRWSWTAAHRGLTWPTLSASASEGKSFSDNDLGTETTRRTDEATLSLRQPLLTGTILSLAGTWTNAPAETDVLGTVTPSRTREVPSVNASLTQPIFIFTRNTSLRARREADLSWANEQDSYRAERLDIESTARSLYYSAYLQSETAEVQRKKYESARLVNGTTRALVRAGKLAQVELVRSDIRAQSDERNIQNALSQFERAMNEVKDFVLLPTEKKVRLSSQLTYTPFNIPLEKLLEAAQGTNSSLLIAERRVQQAEISLGRTKEGDRPSLSATGSYALTRDRSDPAVQLDPYSWQAKLGLDWAFFDATQTRLRVRQAEASLRTARRSYETQFRQLQVSLQNAYIDVKRIEEQISNFAPQKTAAERNVQAIRLQYRNGLTRLTDVFDAENQQRDLELEYLNLLVGFYTARDRIKVLVGTDIARLEKGAPR